MRAVTKTLLILIGLGAASTACRQSPPEQNVGVDNGASATTEIEALPPDESVGSPADELANAGEEESTADEPANAY